MKTCARCGKDFPDSDNFCMLCGGRLAVKQMDTDQLQKKMGILEKKMVQISKPAPSDDLDDIMDKISNLEQKVGSVAESFKDSLSQVDRKAERMGTLKFMPKEEAVSITDDLGKLESKMEELSEAFSRLRSGIPTREQIVSAMEEKMKQTGGVFLTKQQHDLEEMKVRLEMMESRVQGTERDMEEEIERLKKGMGEGEMRRFLGEVNENRRRIAELEGMRKEFEDMKKRSASFNAQEMKENILGEFEKINNELVESIEKKRNEMQRMEQETAAMREGIMSLKGLEERVKGMDSEGITRDLEILKTKTKWLEEQIEGLNIRPLHDRMQELEAELRRVTSSSPMIVE